MVNNKRIQCLLLVFLSLFSVISFAETQLNATVDRSKIYEMDTLNLTIQGQVDVDFSFGGLMNFGLGQSDAPEINGLENDFEILDRQQSYNMQSINGESKAQVLWRYSLAPKTTGNLIIPSAKYKGTETKPIEITVLEGKSPTNSSEPPTIFLEVETDKQSAYVQEQIIYTLRLYTQGLINGELSEPSSTDAIIEPFGEQKKYYRMAFDQRYEVVERKYLIFPQKSGQLTIPEQTFQGISLKNGKRTRVKDKSDVLLLKIKPPAASFSGKQWLPATSLFLNEQWQGDLEKLKVGDSITRKIEISALGLLASALPPVNLAKNPLYKLYIDKPLTESLQHEAGAQSKRTDSFAIVAINEGEIQLNEIRIPWWDTVNDVERVAIIPARQLNIAKNPQLVQQQIQLPVTNTSENPVTETENKIENTDKPQGEANNLVIQTNHLWQTLTALFLILWIFSSLFFYRKIYQLKGQLSAIPVPQAPENTNENVRFEAVLTAIKRNDKQLSQLILNWLSSLKDNPSGKLGFNSIEEIKCFAPEIYQELLDFETQLYSKKTDSTFSYSTLSEILKNYRQRYLQELSNTKKRSSVFQTKHLEPFYK